MAIYHFSVKVISRAHGRSVVAAAAYRAGDRLHDERLDRDHDFTNKSGVVHSEVLLPEGAPDQWRDRERLWNDVEAFEKRKDAQLSREAEFAIPREMSQAQGIDLARDFVQSEFVDRGMIADLNVHWDVGADGLAKPHAHVMMTMREVGPDGFGQKVRDWNDTANVERWRERWAQHVNARLAELDIDASIDHRSLADQGIDLEPQSKIGGPAQRMEQAGQLADRAELHREIARENGERIVKNPGIALDAITHQQATFTNRDMAMFLHRHSDGQDQFNAAMSAVRGSNDLIALGKDGRGEDRFTSREMIETEQRLQLAAALMAERERHRVSEGYGQAALRAAAARGLDLSGEQRAAFDHVTDGGDLSIVIGYAGTGKSRMLGVAREAWESSGLNVRGAALAGIAAEGLENGSGIASRTIASIEHGWAQGRDLLSARDVLVIDEAGMVGTRTLERVLSHAAEAGAKVVLVGDPEQLQAIEAGAAFRSIHEHHGGVETTQVRRQHEDWQQDATRHLATGRTGEAILAYEERGMVHAAETREQARGALVARWNRERQANPGASRIILTHTNAQVRDLNEAAREAMRNAGALGHDVLTKTERGDRQFASGDRIMFLKNDRGLDVKNGTLGTVQQISDSHMAVRADDGRSVSFDSRDYRDLDHGYAATIHKAQGMTVDRAHVLATPGMDRHGSYVALSRHRDGVQLHYGRDDFNDEARLTRTLSRERAKDMASDYEKIDPACDFAERRGISFRERMADMIRKVVPDQVRGMFDGLKLTTTPPEPSAPEPTESLAAARDRAITRHARAVQAIFAMQDQGSNAKPEQARELQEARRDLNSLRQHAAADAEQAYARDESLVPEAARGDTERARQAIIHERDVRTDPGLRADRFVERWNRLSKAAERAYVTGDIYRRRLLQNDMRGMAKSLERDPQMESILANRKNQLGITFDTGRKLGAELAFHQGIDIGRGRGRGISM